MQDHETLIKSYSSILKRVEVTKLGTVTLAVTNSIQTNLGHADNVSIVRSCDPFKTLKFPFSKSSVHQSLTAEYAHEVRVIVFNF